MNLYKLFLECMPHPTWIENIDREIIFLNKAYEKMYNVRLGDVIGKKNKDIFPEEVAIIYDEQAKECIDKLSTQISEVKIGDKYVQGCIFPLIGSDNSIRGIAGIVTDISERKERELQVEKQKNIVRTIVDNVPETIFYKDKDSKFIGFNKKFEEFYEQIGVKEIIGKSDLEIYHNKEMARKFLEQDRKVIKEKKVISSEYEVISCDGSIRIEENVKVPVIDEKGEAWGLVGLSRDITERKNFEKKLKYLSYIDVLTELYNRSKFEEKIKELDKEKYMPLGIIMGDVNGLKIINDTFGHLEGDKLLKEIASVLKEVCEPKGFVFRWGGDEFMILIPNHNEGQCEEIIDRIRRKCQQKCQGSNFEFIKLSIALGEVVKKSSKEDIYQCIKEVEERVYRQKLLESKSFKSSIMDSLKKSLEEKNMETNDHTERVKEYACKIGKAIGFKISELDELSLAAQLHDIGKIAINEEILLKPGKLTKEEFEEMKTHSEKGYRIVKSSSELGNVANCILTHHEKWDGTGYPLGLSGEEIPLMSRIISIADSYDVMTHDRVYKKAMTKKEAIEELQRYAGVQFDKRIVDIFIDQLDE